MNKETVQQLVELNRRFYQTFAQPFAVSRQCLQPGVRRLLELIPPTAHLLDLGCGNGALWQALLARGYQGTYLGVDYSPALLAHARQAVARLTSPSSGELLEFDLTQEDWSTVRQRGPFDLVLAFAVFHHLPGAVLRKHVLCQVRACLRPAGLLFHSEWQFLRSPRLRARIQSWERIGLKPEDLEPDDYLLDWRSGGIGWRYVHHFSEAELAALAEQCDFEIIESFYSDGHTHDLSLYQVWKAR